MKIKPSLSPPEQYIETGLWRQVMQVNQQICRKMEDLDKMEEKSPHDSEVCNYISYVYILSFTSVLQKIQRKENWREEQIQ